MIAALLSWYDEAPADLARAVGSARAAGCTAIVALDGRYAHYRGPGGPVSDQAQYDAIREAATGADLVLDGSPEPWPDEAAKRTALFRLGEQLTGPQDWYFVLDADHELHGGGQPLLDALAATTLDAALVAVHETGKTWEPFRAIFRAVRGLTVKGNHFTVVDPAGRLLWGYGHGLHLADAHDVSGHLTIVHHAKPKTDPRRRAQLDYYRERDDLGLERGPCARCGTRSVCTMLNGFVEIDKTRVTGDFVEVCGACVPWYARRNLLIAERHGIDPVWAAQPRNLSGDFHAQVQAAARGRRFAFRA